MDGRDAEELHLGAREREQERDRVVVSRVAVEDDRDCHVASMASISAAVGRDGCAPKREAASAPAAHARRSASSLLPALEQRDEQARGERVAGGRSRRPRRPAAARRAPPPPRPRAARRPRAERDGDQPVPAAQDLELVAVDDRQVGVHVDRPPWRRVQAEEPARLLPGGEDGGVRDLELAEDGVARRRARRTRGPRSRRARRRSGSRPAPSTRMRATPVGSSTRCAASSSRSSSGSASSAKASRPTLQTNRTSAPSRAAATAWFAPLPPLTRSKEAPVTVSPGRGSRSTRATRSRLTLPTTLIDGKRWS